MLTQALLYMQTERICQLSTGRSLPFPQLEIKTFSRLRASFCLFFPSRAYMPSQARFLFSQFFVFKIRRSKKPQQRVAEQIGIVTVVESKLKLVKVTIHVLHRNLMIRANDRS